MFSKKTNTRVLWTLLLASVVMAMVWEFYPLPDAEEFIKDIPYNGVNFVSEDFPLSEVEKERLGGAFVQKRFLRFNGRNFFITFLDGTKNRHVVHDPRYCFIGGGMKVLSEKDIRLTNGNGVQVQLKKDTDFSEAVYWFSDGERQYSSPVRYWIQTLLRRLTLGLSSNEPILVILQPVDSAPVNWNRLVHELLPFLHV